MDDAFDKALNKTVAVVLQKEIVKLASATIAFCDLVKKLPEEDRDAFIAIVTKLVKR